MVRSSPFADLLAAIHADPDDVDARLVYADTLSDAGDPRGEFIVLQCQRRGPRPTRRERALLAAHGAQWLGKLAAILEPDWRFERGFLARARVKKGPRPKILATAGDPAWATVTHLAFHEDVGGLAMKNGPVVRGARVPAAAVICHPIMRALREVRGIDGDVFVTLCRDGRGLPIHAIEASTDPLLVRHGETYRVTAPMSRAIEAAKGLPQLRRLILHGYPCDEPDLAWLLRSSLAGRLEHLTLENFGGSIDRWVRMALGAHRGLGELVVDYWGRAHFRRTRDGKLRDLSISRGGLSRHQRTMLDEGLARIRKGTLEKLTPG